MKTAKMNNQKKWKRIKLTPIKKEDGTFREYYFLGEDGNEYFRYVDRTGYEIREASEKDTEEWFFELENSNKEYDTMYPTAKMIVKADFATQAKNGVGEEKTNKVMLIYNPAGELIGIMKKTEEPQAIAKIDLSVKNQWIVDAKRDRIMAVIKRMWEETFVYDRMYIMNAKMTRKVFLDSDEITL